MRSSLLALPFLLLVPAAAAAQAPGSYRLTCTDIDQRGPMLRARCRATNGQYVDAAINVDRCNGAGITNSSGRLVCGRGGSDEDNGSARMRPRRGYDQNDQAGYDAPVRRRFDPDEQDAPRRPRYAPSADQNDGDVRPRRRYDPDADQ